MEWGTFITVISAIYLAWFGLNFLYDLFIGGTPKVETASGIHYNISGLMAEEEAPQLVNKGDFEEKPVAIDPIEAPVAPSLPAATANQHIETPATSPVAAATQPAPQPTPDLAESNDWASAIDQEPELINQQPAVEDKFDIPVQGQPIPVSAFIQMLKNDAKHEANAITF